MCGAIEVEDHRIIVFGGYDGDKDLNEAYVFDTKRNAIGLLEKDIGMALRPLFYPCWYDRASK